MNDTELIILGSLGLVGLSALKILKLKNIVNMFNILIPFIDFQGHPSSSMIDRNQLAGLPYSIGDVDFIALCDTGADQVYLDPTTADLVNLASYPKAPPSPGTPSGGHIVPLTLHGLGTIYVPVYVAIGNLVPPEFGHHFTTFRSQTRTQRSLQNMISMVSYLSHMSDSQGAPPLFSFQKLRVK